MTQIFSIKKVQSQASLKDLNTIILKTHKNVFLSTFHSDNKALFYEKYKKFCKSMCFATYNPHFTHFIFYDTLSTYPVGTITLDTNPVLWLEKETQISLEEVRKQGNIAEIIRFGILPSFRNHPHLMSLMFFSILEQILSQKINFIFIEAILDLEKMYKKIGFQYFLSKPIYKKSSGLAAYIMWTQQKQLVQFLLKHKNSSLGGAEKALFDALMQKINLVF